MVSNLFLSIQTFFATAVFGAKLKRSRLNIETKWLGIPQSLTYESWRAARDTYICHTVQDVRFFLSLDSRRRGIWTTQQTWLCKHLFRIVIWARQTRANKIYYTRHQFLAYQRGRCGADKDLNTVLSAASVGQQKGALPHVGGGQKSHISKRLSLTSLILASTDRAVCGIFHGVQLGTPNEFIQLETQKNVWRVSKNSSAAYTMDF